MSEALSRQLLRARDVLDRVLAKTEVGTQDTPRVWTRVDLALRNADDRAGGSLPVSGTRGGSSTPQAREERVEQLRVIAQAGRDLEDLRRIVKAVAAGVDMIDRIVTRQVEVIHDAKRPVDGPLPGCKSCARVGHYAEVWDKRSNAGLCYRCYEARGRFGELPPAGWCDRLHREGRASADRWLKREHVDLWAKALVAAGRPPSARPDVCGHPVWTGTGEVPCVRPFAHDGPCTVYPVGSSSC